ncbi:hypothetical protein ACNRC9_03700 [Ralstonia pseudosolanacearum]|uniref:hypothetical protein n=1 Tax=Ralstonia pseudosolanacearum TaxID=1310165 RepID=UPI003AAD91B9
MTTPKNQNASRNYKRGAASPRSQLKYFRNVALARNMAQLSVALLELIPRLLARGQTAETVAHDLAMLAGPLGTVVPWMVNDLACEVQREI